MTKGIEEEFNKVINKLQEFNNSSFPVLSVYLGSATKQAPSSTLLSTQFHSQIHQTLSDQEKKLFRKDLERIGDFIKSEYNARGKRSVVFFSAGKKLWETLKFEFYLQPLCLVSYSPYIHPIMEALDKYKKYLVLLADREKARLFTVHLGEIREHRDIFNGVVPQKVRAGDDAWDQQNKIFRHIEDHLHRNLQLITRATDDFVKNNPVSFVIIGGHKEMIPKIKKHLKYPLSKMILGEFVTELNIPLNEIFLKSKKIAAQIVS